MSIYQNLTEKQLAKLGTPILIKEYNDLVCGHPALGTYVVEKRLKSVKGFKTCAEGARRVRVLFDQAFGPRTPKRHAKVRLLDSLPPGKDPLPCKAGSKQAALVDLLSQKNGATIEELTKAAAGGKVPWTESRVRSILTWYMRAKGYGVRLEIATDMSRRYYLVVPKGKTIPPHTAKQS